MLNDIRDNARSYSYISKYHTQLNQHERGQWEAVRYNKTSSADICIVRQ